MLTYDSQVEHRHDLRDGGHLALVAAGVAGLDVSEMAKRFSKEVPARECCLSVQFYTFNHESVVDLYKFTQLIAPFQEQHFENCKKAPDRKEAIASLDLQCPRGLLLVVE